MAAGFLLWGLETGGAQVLQAAAVAALRTQATCRGVGGGLGWV